MEKKNFYEQAQALIVQKHQLNSADDHLAKMHDTLDSMVNDQCNNQEILNNLIAQAEEGITAQEIFFVIDEEETDLIESRLYVNTEEIQVTHQELCPLDHIELTDSTDWKQYLDSVENYAVRHDVNFGENPFQNLMTVSQRIALEKRIQEEFSIKGAHCDKYDYMIAATCGLLGGLIDVFFVGLPGQGPLTNFTDDMTDSAVQRFAKLNGWKGPREGKDPTASAIADLERKYKINYDHRHGGDVNGLFDMSTKNHHIKNLGHSPDLVGLFFSLLDQFNSTAHFVDSGRIINIESETFKLQGSNFVTKIYAGFTNWLGHLFSDVAGSSGACERGSGIPIPFYSLLQFIQVGEFGQHRQTFAKIAVQVFEQGYDMRHGMALAIPVLVTESLTRITWVIKQRFYHAKHWGECIPSANNPELRRS